MAGKINPTDLLGACDKLARMRSPTESADLYKSVMGVTTTTTTTYPGHPGYYPPKPLSASPSIWMGYIPVQRILTHVYITTLFDNQLFVAVTEQKQSALHGLGSVVELDVTIQMTPSLAKRFNISFADSTKLSTTHKVQVGEEDMQGKSIDEVLGDVIHKGLDKAMTADHKLKIIVEQLAVETEAKASSAAVGTSAPRR